jgi:hypothetical protein
MAKPKYKHAHVSSLHDDDGDAFLPDPSRHRDGGRKWAASDAEELAEEFLASATSAEFAFEEARNELSEEELGGPFVGLTEVDRFDPDFYLAAFDETNPEQADTLH